MGMNDYLEAKKWFEDKSKTQKRQDAKKSLNSYITQLKMHFDLNDDDVIMILDFSLKSRKNENFIKKWWQIWK